MKVEEGKQEILFIPPDKESGNDIYEEGSAYINLFMSRIPETEKELIRRTLSADQIASITGWLEAESKLREAEKELIKKLRPVQLMAVINWMRGEVSFLMNCPKQEEALQKHSEYLVARLGVCKTVTEQVGDLVKV